MKIHSISAREILDSRGNPTVTTTVELEDGVMAEASVPSGASTGSGEDVELRDRDKNRFEGLGVLAAVSNVNEIIAPELINFEGSNQDALDEKLKELDGSENKGIIGANAILSVSLANARAQAVSLGQELFEYLGSIFIESEPNLPASQGGPSKYTIPVPMFNILNGGKHAGNGIDIQEIMVVPVGIKGFEAKLRAGSEIYHTLKAALAAKGFATGLGDEGGFAPDFSGNEDGLKWASQAIAAAGYKESQVRISLDVAASELYDSKKNKYHLSADKKYFTSEQFIKKIVSLVKKYNLYSVEDGLSEKDTNWKKLKSALGQTVTVGDDLFTTNPEKIETGAAVGIAGGVIIKPNQIGTLSETFEAIRKAKEGNMKVIVSHRSGETEDSFIADLAVAVGADFIKAGAPARSERLAKYNRLTKIEDILKEDY